PRSASARDVSWPIPPDPPVTNATLRRRSIPSLTSLAVVSAPNFVASRTRGPLLGRRESTTSRQRRIAAVDGERLTDDVRSGVGTDPGDGARDPLRLADRVEEIVATTTSPAAAGRSRCARGRNCWRDPTAPGCRASGTPSG